MSSLNETVIPEKHGKAILKEMFKRVGADYDTFDFTQPLWYEQYTWTEEEQTKFIEWVGKYFRQRKVFTGTKRGEDRCLHEAKKLVSNYGWKVKYDDSEPKIPEVESRADKKPAGEPNYVQIFTMEVPPDKETLDNAIVVDRPKEEPCWCERLPEHLRCSKASTTTSKNSR